MISSALWGGTTPNTSKLQKGGLGLLGSMLGLSLRCYSSTIGPTIKEYALSIQISKYPEERVGTKFMVGNYCGTPLNRRLQYNSKSPTVSP